MPSKTLLIASGKPPNLLKSFQKQIAACPTAGLARLEHYAGAITLGGRVSLSGRRAARNLEMDAVMGEYRLTKHIHGWT
ncbi:hypothetical protein T265_08145 [Opisthorchis viverrini]|uniref:Uncharacterized protein n=1 Tax=Opisthorchis viverrini TaxID=6198 RepID=A0A074ZAG2_OPIVI|nr:hypothetical protein T265_08145 [Opisthorchis viverrini]KER24103.1 hypothetical protein T265_08145 [Opisthorchis viverrini]